MIAAPTDTHDEARCACGQLIAKLRPEGVELKCKRCKRIVVIPLHLAREGVAVLPHGPAC